MSPLLATGSDPDSHPPPGADAPRETRLGPLSTIPPHWARVEGASAPAVLIAEDHEDSRDAMRTLLDALGYTVHVASNGAQAVEQARLHLPDLILMDMMMPHVDGFQATRTLRADPRFRDVPIIAITAMEGARAPVLEAGCDDIVAKPVDIRAFIEKVRGWVGSRRSG